MKIAIVGGGFTGLTAAYYLSKQGHQVSIFEKKKFLGGLASGIKVGDLDRRQTGWYLERFYHHIFKSDQAIQQLADDLGLENIWLWQKGGSPIFYQGRVYPFSSPLDLLKFPLLSLEEKLKTGFSFLNLKLRKNYQRFENINAERWLKKNMGEKVWRIVWHPLIKKKFGRYAAELSMVWMWARIFKRSSILGYPQGGFQLLAENLGKEIKKLGGKIFLNKEVESLKKLKAFDKVLFTIATPVFEKICQTKMAENKKVPYLGSIALMLQLKRALTKDIYWLNINDEAIPFLALVEQTNFINKKYYGNKHLVYLGTYLEPRSAEFKKEKERIFKNWVKHLGKFNSAFKSSWIEKHWFFKEKYSQPVFISGFKPDLSFKTPLLNVYLANMTHIYPWDRGVNYAVELGKKAVLASIKG